jgi:hypothetical protein
MIAEAELEKNKALRRDISIICENIIEKNKWRPFKDFDIDITDRGVPFGAYISLIDRKIHIQVEKDFPENVESVLKNNRIDVNKDNAITTIVDHLLVHEYNHHYYCPHSIFLFEEMINGIKSVIEKKEITESKIKSLCFEIHNMFSDTVINTIASHDDYSDNDRAKYRLGQGLADLMVLDQTYKNKKTIFDFIVPFKLDKAMLLFLKSNMNLCSLNPEIYGKIKKYLPKLDDSDSIVKKIVDIFVKDKGLVDRVINMSLIEHDSDKLREHMCDYRSWRSKAAKYAELIYPYLKQEHEWLKNGFTGKSEQYSKGNNSRGAESSGNQQQGKSSSSSKDSEKNEKDKNGESDKESDKEPDKEGKKSESSSSSKDSEKNEKDKNGESDKESDKEEERKKLDGLIKDAQKKDKNKEKKKAGQHGQTGKGVGLGDGSNHFKPYSFEDLDSFYTQAAGNLNLTLEGHKGNENFEVWKGKKSIDELDLKTIDWASTLYFKKNGTPHLNLYEKKMPIEIDAKVRENLGGLPDLCFVFDSSGSMGFNPKVSGEYHTAILAFYSILNNIEKRGIAPLLRYNAVNFSNTTFCSGWQSYRDIKLVKEALFKHQGGGTTIDVSKINDIRMQRTDNYLLFFLSDLGISNIVEITKELISTHDSRAANILIFKLGGRDLYSEPFEHAGIPLFYARNAEDFMHDSIKITDNIYSGG